LSEEFDARKKAPKIEAGSLCAAVSELLLPETAPVYSAIQNLFSGIETALSINNGTRYTLPRVLLADI
jgi:hypothetical protein